MVIKMVQKMFFKRFRLGRYLDVMEFKNVIGKLYS